MSFRWVFDNKDTIFARNKGPAYGIATSHRTEGWGMLSGARFKLHLQTFSRVALPPSVWIVSITDNEGLFKGVSVRHQYFCLFWMFGLHLKVKPKNAHFLEKPFR
jgi:hypothetical protein